MQHTDRALLEAGVAGVALVQLDDTLDPARLDNGVLVVVVVIHEVPHRAEHSLDDKGVGAKAIEGPKEPLDPIARGSFGADIRRRRDPL